MATANEKFTELTRGQVQIAEFLRAFDPIFAPFEGLAKFGISLASGFVAISGTVAAVIVVPERLRIHNWILLCSWVLFLGAVFFGSLELWRTATFRVQMRRFALILLGDKPGNEFVKTKEKYENLKVGSAIVTQFAFLSLGVIAFVAWAYFTLFW